MALRAIDGARTIITGASSGIGRALSLQMARQGARLLLTARRRDRLTDLCREITASGGEAAFVAGDMIDGDLRTELLRTAEEKFGDLDILVKNAGVGAVGLFAEADPERLRRIMEVNFLAPVELIRSALPMLRRGRRPLVVNMSSVLGHRAVPKKSEYCASKFAIHGFSDALRAELAGEVDVLLVSPSTTASEFFDNLLENRDRLPWRRLGHMSPASVARKTTRAIRWGRQEIILSPGGKALVWCDRLCPPVVNRLVARWG